MGNMNSHGCSEDEEPCSAVVRTPACRDLSYLDPRSPTLEIVRTPLEVPPTHHSRLRRLVSLLDPRSPSQLLSRTPLQLSKESAKPIEEPTPRELCLGSMDLGTIDTSTVNTSMIDKDDKVSVHAEDEHPAEHTDLKTARALFFGDMSVTDSPVPSPVSKVEPSPVQMKEVASHEEETKTGADVIVESQGDNLIATEVPCIETATLSTKPALGAVKCMELSTPTVLVRKHGKENILQKQLFQTPDKTRVRTPLGNVSSFHNSPLRR